MSVLFRTLKEQRCLVQMTARSFKIFLCWGHPFSLLFYFLTYVSYLFLWYYRLPRWIKCNVQSINICVSVFPCMIIMAVNANWGIIYLNFLYAKLKFARWCKICSLSPFPHASVSAPFYYLKNCLLTKLLNYAWFYGLFLCLTSLWITRWWVVR